MKKIIALVLAAVSVLVLLTSCSGNKEEEGSDSDKTAFDDSKSIGAISREDGSGTRGAFVELFGIEQKDENGEKVDRTIASASVTSSTAVMLTTVSGDLYSIGYISLGSLNDTVKALKVDGAAATVENIKNSSYKISRPFNIATKGEISDAAKDFYNFIMSADGQKVISDNGYISIDESAAAYSKSSASGKVVVSGSSSVTPVMEKIKEAYATKNSDVTVEIQQSDSSTGMKNAISGVCDIGMSSRELKDSELSEGLESTTIAMDGIAVIANNECPIDDIKSTDVCAIYTGEKSKWSEITK